MSSDDQMLILHLSYFITTVNKNKSGINLGHGGLSSALLKNSYEFVSNSTSLFAFPDGS